MRMKALLTLVALAATTTFMATVPFASGAASKSVVVSTRSVPGLGKILVNSSGKTLYMFVPDKDKKVTCVSTCAKIWPPLKLAGGAKATAAGGAKQALLGSDSDPAGGRVVTYNHWPLYLYLGDSKAGVAYGQALNLNGGLWYVLSPSGALIKHKPTKGGGSTTTTSTTTTGTNTTSTTTTPAQCSDSDNDGDQNAGGPDDADGCI